MLKFILVLLFASQPSFSYQKHKTVFFEFDKDSFDKTQLRLDNDDLNENVFFLLTGYTDPIGSEAYNIYLSERRALNVKKAMISNYNLTSSQIKIINYGADKSQAPNAQKRRVEIMSGTSAEIAELMADSNLSQNTPDNIEIQKSESHASTEPLAMEPSPKEAIDLEDSKEEVPNEMQADHSDKKNNSEATNTVLNEQKKSDQNRYYVGLGFYHNILLATSNTGEEAEWVSKQNYSLEGKYQFKYKNLWLGAMAAYHIQKYEVELSPTHVWNEKNPNLIKFNLNADYEQRRWGVGFDLDFSQVPFIFEDGFNIELKKVFMFGVGARAQYKWIDIKNYSSRLGFELSYPILGSSSIDPEGQLGYIGFIDIRKDRLIKDLGLSFKFYYGFKNYSTNQNDQEEEIAGLLLSLTSLNWL